MSEEFKNLFDEISDNNKYDQEDELFKLQDKVNYASLLLEELILELKDTKQQRKAMKVAKALNDSEVDEYE